MQTYTQVPEELREQLSLGELLLWRGQPRQGLMLRSSDWLHIPFSLMWGGFALFWEWNVLRTPAPGFFVLWGVPFVAVGLYMIAGRFVADAWQRAHTFYALTNERVLIISGGLRRKVRSLDLRLLPELKLNMGAAGRGDLLFADAGPRGMRVWGMAGTGWPCVEMSPGFEQIDDAKAVFDLARKAQRGAR